MVLKKNIKTLIKNLDQTPREKKRIILTNTNSDIKDHFTMMEYRLNGKYDRSPSYTISQGGDIYQHFDPSLTTNFMGDEAIDNESIIISLENVGFLTKNETDGTYYDWKGIQYRGRVFKKSWRGKEHWAKYANDQLNALIELLDYLCIEYDINKHFIGNNVSVHNPETYFGVMCRSNFNVNRFDTSPSLNYELLTEKINN